MSCFNLNFSNFSIWNLFGWSNESEDTNPGFPIDGDTLATIEKELVGNDGNTKQLALKKLKHVIEMLAVSNNDLFAKSRPTLAARISILAIQEWKKGNLPIEETIRKVARVFQTHRVYTLGKFAEEVKIVCSDGKAIFCNKSLLTLNYEYFERMLSSRMQEGQQKDGQHTITFDKFKSSTIEKFKHTVYTWTYAPVEPTLGINAFDTLAELIQLCHQINLPPYVNYYLTKLEELLNQLEIQQEAQLLHILNGLTSLAAITSDFGKFVLLAITNFTGVGLAARKIPGTPYYSIPIHKLALLDATKKLPPAVNEDPEYPGEPATFACSSNSWDSYYRTGECRIEFTALHTALISKFTLTVYSRYGLYLSVCCRNIQQVINYFRSKNIDIADSAIIDWQTLSISNHKEIQKAFEILQKNNSIPSEYLPFLNQTIQTGVHIGFYLSAKAKPIYKNNTPTVAEALRKIVRGFDIRDASQLDYVAALPLLPTDILSLFTTVSIASTLPQDTQETIQKTITEFCPNIKEEPSDSSKRSQAKSLEELE